MKENSESEMQVCNLCHEQFTKKPMKNQDLSRCFPKREAKGQNPFLDSFSYKLEDMTCFCCFLVVPTQLEIPVLSPRK